MLFLFLLDSIRLKERIDRDSRSSKMGTSWTRGRTSGEKLLSRIVNYCWLLWTTVSIVNNWGARESKHSSAFLFWQIIWHSQYRQSKERESLDAPRVLFGSVRHAFRIVNIQYPRNKQQFSWKVVITLSVGRSCRLRSPSRTTRHQRAKERRQRWCHKVVLVSFTFTTSFRS